MPSIKINRALAAASIGSNPASAADMLDAIPVSIVSTLTSRQLAELLDAAWAMCCRSKALADAETVRNGCVWDASRSKLLEVA